MIDISFCRRDEIPALAELIRRDWKADHIFVRNRDFLEWHYAGARFEGAPDDGLSVLVARDAGQLVGMLGLNQTGFRVFGEHARAVWASIWYAKPEVRRQAIGARLWQPVIRADYAAICMVGMNPSVQPFFRSLGYEILVDTPRWCRVLDALGACELLELGGDADSGSVEALVESLGGGRGHDDGSSNTSNGYVLADWDDEAARSWDRSWSERFAPTLVGADKGAEYLAWRYADHPIFRYRVRVARRGGVIDGVVVTRLEIPRDRSERILRIVELLGEPAALTALVAEELAVARREKALFADFYAASDRFALPLEPLGFRKLDPETQGTLVPHRFQPLEFGRIPLTSGCRLGAAYRKRVGEVFACGDYHLSLADGDQDRPS